MLENYLKETYEILKIDDVLEIESLKIRPRLNCKDGFSISIQASETHRCKPKLNLKNGKYEEVELGYPNEYEPLIEEYAEGCDHINTVYNYVPVKLVEEVIKKHGGLI